jgi:hypothetical protein
VFLNIENAPNYVHLLFIAATCFGHTWAIIKQPLLSGKTTAMYTLSFVPIGTSLLLICFMLYFYPIFSAAISVFLFSIAHLCMFWCCLLFYIYIKEHASFLVNFFKDKIDCFCVMDTVGGLVHAELIRDVSSFNVSNSSRHSSSSRCITAADIIYWFLDLRNKHISLITVSPSQFYLVHGFC